MDQVAHFDITGYEVDGRGDPEIEFETCLKFDRRGGFTLADIGSDETKVSISNDYNCQLIIFHTHNAVSLPLSHHPFL